MFGLVRVILGCVFFGLIVLIFKRFKLTYKRKLYLISFLITVGLITISAFVPFENIFVTFDSPESAYRYTSYGNSDVKMVVKGQYSDLVISDKNGSNEYLIIPKVPGGWKVGMGTDTKRVAQRIFDGIIVYVYQYKDTNDFFVTVFDTKGRISEVTDSCNSNFVSLDMINNSMDGIFVTYYANVWGLNQDYWLSVNGGIISVFN